MSESASGCPHEDELVRMVEGALGDVSLAAIESHVDRCEQCAAVIAGLGALDGSSKQTRVVGRYMLDRRIGGGGMGEVWAAWDPQLRRDVAVKLVKPERADDDRERERLKREARALARLTHPNVLAVYDVGDTGDDVFIATELVVGDTLASRGGSNADWRALVKLYSQAARGLAAAHAAGLVHRDIKPANLLIGTDGRVRVADFGLAVRSATPSPMAQTELASRAGGGDIQITQTGYIAGTPAYMAPEQRLGEPADARADQYALCIALVEGIAGRRPLLDIGHDAMIAFVEERRTREPDLDRLCGVMARGLSIDRDDRYPDMDKLANALDACVAPTATSTADVQPIAPVRVGSPRRGMLIAIVGGAAIAGVAAVLIVSQMMNRGASASTNNVAITLPPDASVQVVAKDADVKVAVVESLDASTVPAPGVRPGPGSAKKAPTPIAVVPSTTIISGDVQSQIDLGLAATRRAINKRDAKGCFAALDGLPKSVPPMTGFNIELHRGQCEMLQGDCERGIKRVDAAFDGMGSPPNGDAISTLLCPLTGPSEVRYKRLIAQANNAKGAALCKSYVAPARTLAGEVTKPFEKAGVANTLRQLARCIGEDGDCAEAERVWAIGKSIDQSQYGWDVPKCPMPASAAPPPDPRIAADAFSAKTNKTQIAITRRDTKTCKDYLAMPASEIPQGLQMNYDLIAGFCTMMLGDCKGGAARIAKYDAQINAAAQEDTYCPIAGTLDQRLARMRNQLGAFADKRGSGGSEWCAYMIGAAKTAAGEAQSADDRERAAKVLQHIAWCISQSGRCGEATALVSLSVATDPNANPTPTLSAKCP